MLITDLNYLEAVDTNVTGGTYRPSNNFYFDKKIRIDEHINKRVNKDVYSRTYVVGNLADSEAVATADGYDTLAETLTVTYANSYRSEAYSGSLSAAN